MRKYKIRFFHYFSPILLRMDGYSPSKLNGDGSTEWATKRERFCLLTELHISQIPLLLYAAK